MRRRETSGESRWSGDSFTFGIGVNDGETFASLLGRSSSGVQYLNAGIPGYSTDQEYLFLKDRLLLWRVNEAVLVVFLANDLFLSLFVRMAQAIAETCELQGVGLRLVLMPGQSFAERRDSLSAAFQDYLRRALVLRGAEIGVPVIDLASRLRVQYQETGTPLFHPHEGHLNPAGHRAVAQLLAGIR